MESDYKGKLYRLFREVMLLYNSSSGMTIKQLEEKVGASYRTIYRDLHLLEESGFFVEEVEKGKYVIRGMDKEVRKFETNLHFTPEEAAVLNQAAAGIPENHPLKKNIHEKLNTFSGMEDLIQVAIKQELSRNTELLAKAIRDQKQTILKNYRSSNSQSIRDRVVEPYQFSTDGVFIKCYDLDDATNKTFKIERIEEVLVQNKGWLNLKAHEKEVRTDVFGMSGEKHYPLKLKLSLRAANLLKEEFPNAAPFVFKTGPMEFVFEGTVHAFSAPARFILGLLDEVNVSDPPELIRYISKKIEKKLF